MFKKIVSIAIAAMMVASTAAIAVSAAETDSAAVAAAEDSVAVAAPDGDSSVGADDSNSSEVGAGNKIYFEVDTNLWKNFKVIDFFLVDHTTGDQIITWGSKKGAMTDEGNNIWSFDLDKLGIDLSSGIYGCNFAADWGAQTCDLIIGAPCIGDTAYLTGDQVENNVDSNKKSYYVKWRKADASKYAPPRQITSIGNVIGEAYWEGEDAYKMLLNFIKSDGKDGLTNALKFNGKTVQQTLDDTAKALGLGQDDIEKAIKESGKTLDWKKESSSAQEGSSSGDSSSSSGDSSSNSGSSSSSSSGSSSSGSSSSGSSSVSSGQETTIFFVFGGVMLAAAGVIFLARKRRDF